ncbi:AEC family transporter [Neisseria dentiae]|uniref:AEC family transporter n=1 Tax=Neisseria dentiae TaxID=194197 RepID=UPI0035A01EB1
MLALIATGLIPLILCIISGILLNRYRFIPHETWLSIDKLNYYFLFPALLFSSLSGADIGLGVFESSLFAALAVVSLLFALVYLCKFLFKINEKNLGVYVQSLIRFNTYIGLALSVAVFQEQGLALFSLIIAFSIPLINVFSVLSLSHHQHVSVRIMVLNIIKNPLIISCVVALAFNLLSLPLWQGLKDFIKLLASASLPLGLLCIGAGLTFMADKKDYALITANSLLRLIAAPAAAYLLCTLAGLGGLERQIITLFFALPTAPSAYALTKMLGGNHALMASIISLQTLLAMITLPVVLWLII